MCSCSKKSKVGSTRSKKTKGIFDNELVQWGIGLFSITIISKTLK